MPKLISGFSSKEFGDLKVTQARRKNLKIFLTGLGLDVLDLVTMEQVYGNKVVVVDKRDKGKVIAGTDGLAGRGPGIFLGVNSADCLPCLFSEPKTQIVAVAHGSWQTIRGKIAQKTAEAMIKLGARIGNIHLEIGPHIGVCCYRVPQERSAFFEKEFGPDSLLVRKTGGKFFLDLTRAVVRQLLPLGILEKNIRISSDCTFCQSGRFFSFRREGKGVGEMLGVVGFKDA